MRSLPRNEEWLSSGWTDSSGGVGTLMSFGEDETCNEDSVRLNAGLN